MTLIGNKDNFIGRSSSAVAAFGGRSAFTRGGVMDSDSFCQVVISIIAFSILIL